jgi:hypothetical protein
MTVSRNSRTDIHPVQQPAAHQVAKHIGIVGKNNFGIDAQTLSGKFCFHDEKIFAKDKKAVFVSVFMTEGPQRF